MTETSLDPAKDNGNPVVLVIEPSAVLSKIVTLICESRNVTMMLSQEVGAALDEVSTLKPVAVLTSLELSGLSGTSLIAALKVCPRHRGIPVGLMTSRESLSQFRDNHEPDAIIQKGSAFADEVESFLERYGIGVDASAESSPQSPKLSGRILLAENTRSIKDRFCTQLHVAGAEVVCVESGAEAVTAASEEWFDLILMDTELPEMSGGDAAGKIRSLGVTTPMIAATREDRDIFLAEAEVLGFDDVFTKPMDRRELIESCAEYLARSAAA